jgi:hypothetical protein
MGSGKIDLKPLINRTFEFQEGVDTFIFALKMPGRLRQGANPRWRQGIRDLDSDERLRGLFQQAVSQWGYPR